ncbi:hypothetical protein FOZ62_005046, partial [Perkinsus olseni]
MGPSPRLLSEVIKVRVVRRPKEELDSDMSYFSDYVSMGDHIVVTLSEVYDDEAYESLFNEYTPEQMLMDRMKFITCPANLVPFDTVHPAKGADGMLSDQYEAKTKDGEPLFVKYLPAEGFAHDFCLELDVYGREQSCLAFFNEAGIH